MLSLNNILYELAYGIDIILISYFYELGLQSLFLFEVFMLASNSLV